MGSSYLWAIIKLNKTYLDSSWSDSACILIYSGSYTTPGTKQIVTMQEPAENNLVTFLPANKEEAAYIVAHDSKVVIDTSYLGFDFKGQPAIGTGLTAKSGQINTFSETWEMPWGEQSKVINPYNELEAGLTRKNAPQRPFSITFRGYDKGLGFRCTFPGHYEGYPAFRASILGMINCN